MLSISVQNRRQNQQLLHPGGPLEFGRGPQQSARRVLIEDLAVSRDQLRVEELGAGRVRLENLSLKKEVALVGAPNLAVRAQCEVPLPVRLAMGDTVVDIEHAPEEPVDPATLMTVFRPLQGVGAGLRMTPLRELGDAPPAEQFTHWLETLIALQRTPVGSPELHQQTARALVELIGLDTGIVLLHREGAWCEAARWPCGNRSGPSFSRTILARVATERRTYYQDFQGLPIPQESLAKVAAVVASPVFGVDDEVAGALYGLRRWRGVASRGVRPLEAQVVQLLAAAVGANLVRTVATRRRVQFEQFFSAELAEELERNPDLLEGRDQEVTVLVSDLRGFTALSERLGPETTCRLVRDVMEQMSERIAEHSGVIVDYAGDGILAMWNAPRPQADHVARACRAGLAMLGEVPTLTARWQDLVGGPLVVGIGINTGPARVGNTGSSRKLKYGPHGHTVNLASRVQDATKRMGAPLLITRGTRDRLPIDLVTRLVGAAALPGVAEPVDLYEVRLEGPGPE